MRPTSEPAIVLAQRLRALRETSLGTTIKQPELARLLGVSVPSISSWESLRKPKLPPVQRLSAYATLFSTERSLSGARPKLLDVTELTAAEQAKRDELERELLLLRAVAAGETAIPQPRMEVEPNLGGQETLLDQRSLMQHMLGTLNDCLQTQTLESIEASRRLVSLLESAPWLVASAILSDIELSRVEAEEKWATIWIAWETEEIEFHYPAAGPSFGPIVLANLARGVGYRYLVPESPRATSRAKLLSAEYPNLEVRFLDTDFWRTFTKTMDELVVYESAMPNATAHQAYYKYPGSGPTRWVTADSKSAVFRVSDLHQLWKTAKGMPR